MTESSTLPRQEHPIDETGNDFKSIQETAKQLGITHRALRFYEDNGLITPGRAGSTRIYSRRDVGRIQLILRGKKLGFKIREIKEFLDLYDVDPNHIGQMEHLLERVREKLASLAKQKAALEETIGELRKIEQEALERLQAKPNS